MADSNFTAKIRIDGDAKGAQQAVDVTGQALDGLEGHTQKARTGSEQLNASFNKLGIRSAGQIEADIQAINQALADLARRTNVTGDEFDRAWAAGQAQIVKLKGELSGVSEVAGKGGLANLAGEFTAVAGKAGIAAAAVAAASKPILDASLAAEKLQKGLNAVNGDAKKTESDLAFLKETAQRLGINLESSSSAFVKLSAAAKGTSLEGQATRDIFSSLGGAMSQLGLSSAESERAFVAIAQMMSKGTVNAEELKGQLGDVLPGAMAMAARATGLTTAELGKLMESGGVLAEDFLPRFAEEVKKSFGGSSGEVQGLSNTIERLKNTWSQAFAIFGQTGVLQSLAAIVGIVSEAFLVLATGVTTVTSAFFGFVKSIGVVVGAIGSFFTGSFSLEALKQSFSDIGNEVVSNIEKMARLTGTSQLVAEALGQTGVAASNAAKSATESGAGWTYLNSAYDKAAKAASDYVEQVKKSGKASTEQGEFMVKLAELSKNEVQILLAKEEAARRAAAASAELARALDIEAKTLQAKAVAMEEEIKGEKSVSEEKRKSIEEAKKSADAKTEEARAALAAADASKVAVAAAEAETIAREDNRKRIVELKAAYEQAAIAVDVLKAAQAAGEDVDERVKEAQIAKEKAARLYNDALSDQAKYIQDANTLKQAQLDIDGATIRLAIEQQKTIYEVAKARGNEYAAAHALVEIKKLEAQLAELNANAKRLEAQASLAKVQADREELLTKGPLTEAQALELQAREASAGVKLKEAEIATELAKRMRSLIDATTAGGQSATNAARGYDDLASSMGNAASAAGRLNKERNITPSSPGGGDFARAVAAADAAPVKGSDGVYRNGYGQHTNANGEVLKDLNGNPITNSTSLLSMGNSPSFTVRGLNLIYKQGATVDEAKAAEKFFNELANRNLMRINYAGHVDGSALQQQALDKAAEEAIKLARIELAGGKVDMGNSVNDYRQRETANLNLLPGLSNTALSKLQQTSRDAAAQTSVKITIGNQTKTINTASFADNEALVAMLRQLEQDAGRAM